MTGISDYGHWTSTKTERTLKAHRNSGLELVYVANGDLDWDYDGQRVPVSHRQVSFSWPWETHGAVNARVPACELYWVVIPLARDYARPQKRVQLHPSLHVPPGEETDLLDRLRSTTPPVVAASSLLRTAFPELVCALRDHPEAMPVRIRSLVLLILSEIAMASRQQATSPTSEALTRVRHFLQELHAHCDEPWTLDSMAQACDLKRSRFTALVKEHSGDSPVQHLNRVRVARARTLLATTPSSVTEIAFACGFSSSQYFSTVFRQFYGQAPGEVRGKA